MCGAGMGGGGGGVACAMSARMAGGCGARGWWRRRARGGAGVVCARQRADMGAIGPALAKLDYSISPPPSIPKVRVDDRYRWSVHVIKVDI